MSHRTFSASDVARPHIPGLTPYTPGKQPSGPGWVKLNTNENPYPPSPSVEAAIRREAECGGLRLYPEPRSTELRAALGRHHGLAEENVCVGNGSDDILNLLVRVFCNDRNGAVLTVPGYSLYPVLIAIRGGKTTVWEFDRRMELDVDRLAASEEGGLLFLTSPNAPTGVRVPASRIAELAERFPGVLVVDEAYADFAKENAVGLVHEHPNLCITRTFSKSYSLAGLRVGYALASPGIIELLDRVRDSYNVNRISQAAALAALEDQRYFEAILGKIKRTRDYYQREFRQRGWFTYESEANFLFTEPVGKSGEKGPETARSLYDHLFRNRVLVRHFPRHALTSGFLRISVGSEAEMLALSETIESWAENE